MRTFAENSQVSETTTTKVFSSNKNCFAMCPPKHFDVQYEINPYMRGNIHKVSHWRAYEQWQQLCCTIEKYAHLVFIPPQPGWPDMVFTANAGLVLGNQVILSRFYHKERQGEEPFFRQWFESQGYTIHEMPKDFPFEGAGDALPDKERGLLWAGYGFRSKFAAHAYITKYLNIEVLSLRLVDERFYHLDTCLCPLSGGYLLYYPSAFDAKSNCLIDSRVPESKRIAIEEEDAINFACNAVNIDQTIVLSKASDGLKQQLVTAGFQVIETPVTEFMKSGGATKCLTLKMMSSPAFEDSKHVLYSQPLVNLGAPTDRDNVSNG